MNININHFYTENKLKVIYAQDDTAKLVSLHLFIRVGSVWESDCEAGYSHLLEHLVFKSTQNHPHNTLMDIASQYGSVLNAYTEYESTCFYITLPSEYLCEGLALLAEIAFKANFSDNDFECERRVVIEELKQYQNDPEESLVEKIPSIVSPKSPYTKTIIGKKTTLTEAKPDDLRAFYQKYYTPQNAFLCVAGDFDLCVLQKHTQQCFLQWDSTDVDVRWSGFGVRGSVCGVRGGETTFSQNCSPHITSVSIINCQMSISHLHHLKKAISHDILAFILPEFSDNHPLSHAAHLVAKVFCVGKNSRLYQRLYVKEKLVDNIKINSISGIYDGVMIVLCYPRKGITSEQIVSIFVDELCTLMRFGLKTEEVYDNKQELLTSANYVFEFMEILAQSLGTEELLGDYQTFFTYEKDIENINKDDIRQAIVECYEINKLHIVKAGKTKLDIKHWKWENQNITLSSQQNISQNVSPALHDVNGQLSIVNTNTAPITVNYQLSSINSLRLLLKPTPHKHLCGVSLSLRVSQLDEDETTLGLNQLTATAMLYGNAQRDYRQCLRYCSVNGIHFAISCGKETTKIHFKCFPDHLIETLHFMHSILTTPTYPIEHIKNLQKTYSSNIQRIKDYPQSEAVYLWKQMLLGKNSNVLSKDGSIKTLNSFTRKMVCDWYQQKILGSPASLCIVGDFVENDVRDTIAKLFSNLTFSTELGHRPITISPSKKNKIISTHKSDQSIINLGGFCMPGKDTHLRAAMNVLSQIIGGEISSRMFDLLREKHSIAYSAEFDYDLLTDLGYYDMFTIVDKKRETQAIDLLLKMQDNLKKNGVTNDELSRAKNFIIGQMRIDEESVLSQAQVISSILTLGADYDYYLQREDRVRNVTAETITQIVNDYFCYEDQYLHILR